MSGITFGPQVLADSLTELAGYKAGLALSVDEICDQLSGTEYPDIIRTSETDFVRLRPEEYDAIYYKLLHRTGVTEEEFNGDITGLSALRKYKKTAKGKELYEGVMEVYVEMMPQLMDEAEASGTKTLDPTPLVQECLKRFGVPGAKLVLEKIMAFAYAQSINPHFRGRYKEWEQPLALSALFSGKSGAPEDGKFIDQRFINYLCANPNKLGEMHWRKFEELTAEFFDREGFRIELGPGSNDDGVDVRIWKPTQAVTDAPLCLVQCKRQKDKVEKVTVKGLAADVAFEGADYGVIVTTSELSPGARNTISARGYPVGEINREKVCEWVTKLRKPGTGVVRV